MPPFDSDTDWLLGDEAHRWLAEISQDLAQSHFEPHRLATRLRKVLSPERSRLVLELAELRRRGRQKFAAADDMFFTRVGLEQATDQWVAAYKAKRLVGKARVADLCCGIGGDASQLAQAVGSLLACDRSDLLVEFARRNLAVVAGTGPSAAEFMVADVTTLDLAGVDAWHLDPDRRPLGRRTSHAQLHEPPDNAIDRMLQSNGNAALKLAPGCEVPHRWIDAGELEWISRAGQCRQLVVWFGNLSTEPGTRRASVLAGDGTTVRTFVGCDVPVADFVATPGRYVYEPDAAVLAAGLEGALAAERGWAGFASTTGYLTSDRLAPDAGTQVFEVVDVLPLKPKLVATYLRQRQIGRVEIKHRGVDVSPETFRRSLKLNGANTATLIITRQEQRRILLVTRRVAPQELPETLPP